MHSFVSWFSCSGCCSWVSFILLSVSVSHSFLLLRSIPLNVYTTFVCLLTYQWACRLFPRTISTMIQSVRNRFAFISICSHINAFKTKQKFHEYLSWSIPFHFKKCCMCPLNWFFFDPQVNHDRKFETFLWQVWWRGTIQQEKNAEKMARFHNFGLSLCYNIYPLNSQTLI